MPETDAIKRELRQQYPRPSAAATVRVRAAVIQTASERSHKALAHGDRRRRWTLVAVGAVTIALAAGLSFYLIPRSTNTPHPGGASASEGLTVGPTGPFGSTIDVMVDAPVANATLQLQVLREQDEPGADPSTEKSQVVYETRVPMTDVNNADAKGGPLSTWSGTLSTSDWSGGCQQGFIYSITARAFDSTGELAALLGGSSWRTCEG